MVTGGHMDASPPTLQEGTFVSTGHMDVPALNPCRCQSVTDILSRVGDKWSMQVVMRLGKQPMRFNALCREVEGISQRMLTRTLRGLERDGLVSRTVTPSQPPQVAYALTPLGVSLCAPVAALGEWAIANRQTVADARNRYDQEYQDA